MANILFNCPEAATGGVLEKKCSQKFCIFHRETPVLGTLFGKVGDLPAF